EPAADAVSTVIPQTGSVARAAGAPTGVAGTGSLFVWCVIRPYSANEVPPSRPVLPPSSSGLPGLAPLPEAPLSRRVARVQTGHTDGNIYGQDGNTLVNVSPTRGLLSDDPSAVVQGRLHGDLLAGQHRLQRLPRVGLLALAEPAAVAEYALAVDDHRRGGYLGPEQVRRAAAGVEHAGHPQPFLLGEGSNPLGRLARIGVQGDHRRLARVVLRQFVEV